MSALYPRLLVKLGVVCVTCQSMEKHDVNARLDAATVQRFDRIVLTFSDWR